MLLHRLVPRPVPRLTFSFFRPNRLHKTLVFAFPATFSSSSLSIRPLRFCEYASSARSLCISEAVLALPKSVNSETECDDEIESEDGDFGAEEEKSVTEGVLELNAVAGTDPESSRRLPDLSVKEKKELASYAHSLGKKLKSQQVGKSGVTGTVVTALIETLEANELLKIKIHNNCPDELDDVVKQLEEGTGSVVVGQIGRTVILYRPSLTKLKAEEKKKQARRIFVKKQPAPAREQQQSKTELPRQSARGRRGSSRFGA